MQVLKEWMPLENAPVFASLASIASNLHHCPVQTHGLPVSAFLEEHRHVRASTMIGIAAPMTLLREMETSAQSNSMVDHCPPLRSPQ